MILKTILNPKLNYIFGPQPFFFFQKKLLFSFKTIFTERIHSFNHVLWLQVLVHFIMSVE